MCRISYRIFINKCELSELSHSILVDNYYIKYASVMWNRRRMKPFTLFTVCTINVKRVFFGKINERR
jgi:hypothetical protein